MRIEDEVFELANELAEVIAGEKADVAGKTLAMMIASIILATPDPDLTFKTYVLLIDEMMGAGRSN